MCGVYILIPNRCRNDCWDHSHYTGDLLDQGARSAIAKMVEKEF